MKRSLVLLITCLVLLLTPLFVACSPAPPETTTAESSSTALSTATPAPTLIDLHSPDELKTRFNQDAGVPRIILLVSPT
jgi:hypothetical protein